MLLTEVFRLSAPRIGFYESFTGKLSGFNQDFEFIEPLMLFMEVL